jgi:hypothetical protein
MERTGTFFGIFGQILRNSLRWLIRFGRRYPIVAALYLIVFCIWFISYGNQPVIPPVSPSSSTPPLPPVSSPIQNPVPYSNPNPAPTVPAYTPSPPPLPTVEVANVKAYKNGNTITIRFDKAVSDVQLSVDGGNWFTLSCQLTICMATLPAEALQIQVTWFQGTDSFSTKFRL